MKKYEIERDMTMSEAFKYAEAIVLLFGGEIQSVHVGPNGNPCIIWFEALGASTKSLAAWLLESENFELAVGEMMDDVQKHAAHLEVE